MTVENIEYAFIFLIIKQLLLRNEDKVIFETFKDKSFL